MKLSPNPEMGPINTTPESDINNNNNETKEYPFKSILIHQLASDQRLHELAVYDEVRGYTISCYQGLLISYSEREEGMKDLWARVETVAVSSMAYDPERERLYVCSPFGHIFGINKGARTYDTVTGSSDAMIQGAGIKDASRIALDYRKQKLYVVHEGDSAVTELDMGTKSIGVTVEPGKEKITAIAANSNSGCIALARGSTLWIITDGSKPKRVALPDDNARRITMLSFDMKTNSLSAYDATKHCKYKIEF